jgi:hypothetical protein
MRVTLSPSRILRGLAILFLAVCVLELIVFNLAVFYGYSSIRNIIIPLLSSSPGSGTVDQVISGNPVVQKAVSIGKNGGFDFLLRSSLERVYVLSYPNRRQLDGNKTRDQTSDQSKGTPEAEVLLGSLGLDVSHSGEWLLVFKRIQARRTFPYEQLVVDIGANDGLLGSNSYNFIQLGWHAILVEPMSSQIDQAKVNLNR